MRGIMVIFVVFAFAVPSVISTPCNQTGSHAALRGQPEQCENVHMPSTSLSFNTSAARSEFFNLATLSKTAWPSVQKDCFLEVSCD